MKALVADAFEKSGLDGLAALGCEVLYEPSLEGAALGARLAESGAEVLVVRGTKERMIPFVGQYVKAVERGAGRIIVDWKADYDA